MNEINSKTGNIDKIAVVNPDSKTKTYHQKGDGSFDKILTNQIGENGKELSSTGQSTFPPSLQEIQGSFKAQHINLEFNKNQFMQKLNSSLDMLELFAQMLQDPDKTLKEAWDILEQLSVDTKSLEHEFKAGNNLPGSGSNLGSNQDSDLKSILTQIVATVEVEQIKFNRGDYT